MSKKAKKYPPNGRVHRAKVPGYTQINNHIFHTGMSLEAFALLVLMLQLSPKWHFTVEGLAAHIGCSAETVESYLRELESLGHLVRHEQSRSGGRFGLKMWEIYEVSRFECSGVSTTSMDSDRLTQPLLTSKPESLTAEPPALEKPISVLPAPEKPVSVQPAPEFSAQINIQTLDNKCTLEKESSNNLSTEALELLEELKRTMNYDGFLSDYPDKKEILDTLFQLLTEAEYQTEPVSVGNEIIDADEYRDAIFSVNELHIQYILQCLNKSAPVIRNLKSYLQRCMLNAVKQLDDEPNLCTSSNQM